MTSSAISSRKSLRLDNQTQKSSPVTRKSERLVTAPPPLPPSSTATATPRKSERLASGPASSTVTRKSERLLKVNTPSPVRTTARSKKRSLLPVKTEEGLISSETKKNKREKKEKSIQMLQMETSEVSTEYEQCVLSKRRLGGRSYKARFKPQKIRVAAPDSDEELRRSETSRIYEINNADNGINSSQSIRVKKDLNDELSCRVAEDLRKDLPEGVCEVAFIGSDSCLNDSDAHALTNIVEADIASVSPENGLPVNGSNEGNIEGLNTQASELVTPLTSSATEKPDFVANCFLCLKKRRLVFASPEEELCSCTNAPKGNLSDLSSLKRSKGSFVKLQKLPAGGSTTAGDSLLNNVNKLREFWHKNQNAVIVDEIERMVNVIYFIFSLSDVHKPFLVTATSDTLAQWEAEFNRLKPSINVVVYHADRGSRNSIRSIEFQREEDGKMLQVLLCSIDVITEDFQILKHLKWEMLILDECQFSMNFDHLKMLDADMRILLFSGSLKDTRDEYLTLLSFLYPPGDLDKADGLSYDQTDGLVKLRESFSRFVAYDRCYDSSKFVEYWVPVPLSNLQLEQYCHTLLSGSSALTSNNMKNNVVGEKVHDILLTVRKCCDHPYAADPKLVVSRLRAGYPISETVDFGIKASGKLHFLCKILSKIKSLKLRALVLFQSFDGSKESLGDMLEDLLRDRFGADSYERIERQLAPSKKQAAVNRFGKEDSKQFVLLLGTRACQSIKLAVDIVFIFSSDWKPENDIRTLERISISSQSEKVPICRLYCSSTIEEKALILGKQHMNLDSCFQMVSRGTASNTLLMWGASHLFSRLEDYHASSSNVSDVDVTSEHALLDNVVKDLMSIFSDTATSDSQHSSVISKAFMRGGIYQTNGPLLGERKVQSIVVEEPPVFWKKLLMGRSPRWKFSPEPTLRIRKRILYSDESPRKSDEPGKKRKKMDGTTLNAIGSVQPDVKEGGIGGSEEDELVAGTTSRSRLPFSADCRMAKPHSTNAQSSLSRVKSFSQSKSVFHPEIRSPSDGQQSLHVFLKAKIAKLWKALKLSEDVLHMVQRILAYLMENHKVYNEDTHVLQAFQMSLCWIAVDILGQKIDRKGLLLEAKKTMNFECPEELVDSAYKKLASLKGTFQQLTGKTRDFISFRNVASPLGDTAVCSSSSEEPRVKAEVEDISSLNPEVEQNQEPKYKNTVTRKQKRLRKVQKACEKRKLMLRQKHEEEIHEFYKIWKEKREKLEEEHKVELVVVSAVHSQSAMKMDKLKAANAKFALAISDLERSKERERKEQEKKHAAEMEEENSKCENWLAEAEANYGSGQSTTSNDINTCEFEAGDDPQFSKTSGSNSTTRVLGSALPATTVSDAVVSDASANGETEVVGCRLATENELVTMQVGIPTSAEQLEAADVSLQNSKDFAVAEVSINGQTVNEIPSINRNTEAGSAFPEKHGGSLREGGSSAGGMDPADHFRLLDIRSANASCNGTTTEQSVLCRNTVASSHGSAGFHNKLVVLNGRYTMLHLSADFILSADFGSNADLQAVCVSDCQVDREQSDPPTTITDSAVCGSRPDSHTVGGPNDIPVVEHPTRAQAQAQNMVSPTQVDESAGEQSDPWTNIMDSAVCGSRPDSHTAGGPIDIPAVEHPARAQAQNMVSPTQVDENAGEQSDPCTDIMDSAVRGSCPDSHTAGGPIDIPAVEHPAQTQNMVSPQVDESAGELHKQPAVRHGKDTMPLSSDNAIDTVDSQNLPDLSIARGTDHEPVSELFGSSQNHTLTKVARNAAEVQNGAVLPTGSNLVSAEGNSRDHPYLSTADGIDREPNGELLVASQNPALVSVVATYAAASQNQAALQSGPNPRSAWQANLPLLAEPLQSELEKICKEKEQIIKLHEDTKMQLKSECEKEIEELAAQIRNKYVAKLKGVEASFSVKKTEIETNYSKVLMNKLLAEAFRSKCLDFRPSGAPPSAYLQHQQMILSQSSSRHSPVGASSSVGQPASMHLTVNPVYPAQRYPFVALSSPQPSTVHQAVNQSTHRSANLSGIPSRTPPHISAITPTTGSARVGSDVRAPAPHLQPFRPPAPLSLANGSSNHPSDIRAPAPHMANQRVSANLPSNSSPFPPLSPQHPITTQLPRSSPVAIAPAPQPTPSRINQSSGDCKISEVEGGVPPGLCNPPLSSGMELVRNVSIRAGGGYQGNNSPSLPVPVSNNKAAGDVSTAQAVSTIRCTNTESLVSDVVCLSDDDN